MFYSQFILAKKGPLGTIWIAAHLERKLRKNQVADTDIGVSVDSILFPEVPIALRLSSHLLLGVVRIYSKKVNYLFDDCSDALLKIKQAFRSAAVDLPPEQSKAPYHSITLPETFDLDDFEIPDSEILQGNFVDHHVSAREQITLQDTMEGASFPTSQFGPDERFGDGDASQIGLDIDEELFLDKGEAAGTSSTLMDIDGDPQPSAKASSPHEEDGNNGDIFSPPISSPANHAPSTPGLIGEPNLPSAQGVISDDHMDEDHNPLDFATKENASGQSDLPNFGSVEFQADEDLHHLNEQKTEMQTSPGIELSTEAAELISSGNGQLNNSSEHFLATSDMDNVGNTLNVSFDNENPKGTNEDDFDINGIAKPLTETEPNGTCLLMPDGKSENNLSPVGIVDPTSEPQSIDHNNLDGETLQASNIDKSLSAPSMPVLQACSSDIHHTCNGVGASGLPTENDGHCSFATSEKEDGNTVSGVSAEVEDNINKDGKLGDMIPQENNLEKEHDSRMSDLPATEKLLSMPELPVEQSSNFLVEFTPGDDHLPEGDGDAAMDKMISGRKRSYTESTLTIQSLNSAESSGATQSKRSVGYVPEDDDLLSSILVGKKSTGLKLMSTPPVTQPPPSKRQRAVRSTAHKRKVLVDEATVLHGDAIRQQLTSTEDIRRVRKKAPGTRQEIWLLQKQILEDEFFTAPALTGMSLELVSLHHAAFDLSGLRVIKDDHRNEQNEMENQGQQGSTLAIDGSSIEREMLAFENELTKAASQKHASSDERVEKELNVPQDASASGLDQGVSLGPTAEVNGDIIVDDSATPNKTSDMIELVSIEVQPTREDVSTLEGVCGVDTIEQSEVNANMCENVDFETSNEKPPLEESEAGTTEVREDSTMPLEDGVGPISDQFMEENQSNWVEDVKTDEISASEQNQDGNDPTPDCHNGEEMKLNSSYTEEGDFSSRNDGILTEGEALEYFKADPKIFSEATPICAEYPDASGHADFGTDVIEHDTDFLNVDDDDVDQDYEDDTPGNEENRVLDNSGWSSRTRAVANYLQVLFEKGDQQGKKDVSLESLLAGKTRKEASRMFFETLVLKTKDYIQAEQDAAFCDIRIKPRGKLLK